MFQVFWRKMKSQPNLFCRQSKRKKTTPKNPKVKPPESIQFNKHQPTSPKQPSNFLLCFCNTSPTSALFLFGGVWVPAPEILVRRQAVFRSFDRNGDGHINRAELSQALRSESFKAGFPQPNARSSWWWLLVGWVFRRCVFSKGFWGHPHIFLWRNDWKIEWVLGIPNFETRSQYLWGFQLISRISLCSVFQIV